MEERVGYCYLSGLEKTLCKWDINVPAGHERVKGEFYGVCRLWSFVFELWLYIEGARNDSNQNYVWHIYKNVEGYFFKAVCCSSCMYKSQFQVERVWRNANCIGFLGRLVFIYRAGVVFILCAWMFCHLILKYELHVPTKLFNFVAVRHLMFNSMPALFVRLWNIVRSKCGKQRSQWNWSATSWNLAEKELLSYGELAAEKQISSEFSTVAHHPKILMSPASSL